MSTLGFNGLMSPPTQYSMTVLQTKRPNQ